MLVLSRKKNESIIINNEITIVVVEIKGDKVRLGVEAPGSARASARSLRSDPAWRNRRQSKAFGHGSRRGGFAVERGPWTEVVVEAEADLGSVGGSLRPRIYPPVPSRPRRLSTPLPPVPPTIPPAVGARPISARGFVFFAAPR